MDWVNKIYYSKTYDQTHVMGNVTTKCLVILIMGDNNRTTRIFTEHLKSQGIFMNLPFCWSFNEVKEKNEKSDKIEKVRNRKERWVEKKERVKNIERREKR